MQDQESSKEIFHGKLITLRIETIPQPGGGVKHFEIIEHPDAVAVVALRSSSQGGSNAETEVVLVSQERPVIKKKTWELPAGLMEKSEQNLPQLAAARELLEETGCVADHWQLLTREYPSPGFSTEAITIYLATQVHSPIDSTASDTPFDTNEISLVNWIPLSEALTRCASGEIEDGKTLLGLYLVHHMMMSEAAKKGEGTMPRDLTNMPFSRSASFREKDSSVYETRTVGDMNTSLNIENMLLEEFNYASVTAYQAMEDRARVSSLYYLLLGALASALLAIYQLGGDTHSYSQPLVVALFLLAGLLSITFFEKIIRLRQAYRESLICMNVIKEFYIQQFQQLMPQIEKAFRWRLKTIPAGERIGSVTFAISALIGLMGSLCFANAVLVGTQPGIIAHPTVYGFYPYIIPLVVFVICLLCYIGYYRLTLNKHKEAEILEHQAEKIGLVPPETMNS